MKKYIGMFREIYAFLRQTKKWWLIPIIALLLIIGFVLVISSGSILSPLIYTLF